MPPKHRFQTADEARRETIIGYQKQILFFRERIAEAQAEIDRLTGEIDARQTTLTPTT